MLLYLNKKVTISFEILKDKAKLKGQFSQINNLLSERLKVLATYFMKSCLTVIIRQTVLDIIFLLIIES
jgi:hypothetical protein